MAFLDTFIQAGSVRKQKRLADEFVEKMYNPNIYNEGMNTQRELASQGVNDEAIREKLVNQIYNTDISNELDIFGGNVGAAIAGLSSSDENRRKNLVSSELDLSIQDERVKMEGMQNFDTLQMQRDQVRNTRDAKLKENKMLMEMELANRRSRLAGNIFKTGLMGASLLTGNTKAITGLTKKDMSSGFLLDEKLSGIPMGGDISSFNFNDMG
jgi:hypothetical protein